MASSPDAPKRPRRWVRRLALAAAAGLIGLVVLVLALPWIVSLPVTQRFLSSQANRILAPGSVRFDKLSISWNRSTEIDGLVLRDAQGDDLVVSPKAHFSWSLREMIFTQPVEMTLTLDRATVDIQREASGQIDLLETLKPVMQDQPKHSLLIRIPDGKLRFRAEGLNEPFHADPADISLDLNAAPRPIAWRMKLYRAVPGGEPGRVEITGSMSHEKRARGVPENLALTILADRWPWVFSTEGLKASGGLTGKIEVEDRLDQLALRGDTRVMDLMTSGDRLSGDQLKLNLVSLAWDIDRKDDIWTARRLDVTTPMGTVNASGNYPPAGDRGAHVDSNIDLAALSRQLPRTLRLREDLHLEKGAIELRADVASDAGKATQTISASARLTDLSARHGSQRLVFRDPATLDAKLHRQADALTLDQLDVKTPFLTATGRGDLDRGIAVSAVVDLGAGSQRLREWIDLGQVELAGQGKIDAGYRRIVNRFEASAGAEFKGLDLKGLPTVESFHRDLLTANFKAAGGAGTSGLPSSLQDLTLTAGGDAESLSVTAARDAVAGTIKALAKGSTRLVVSGKKQTAEAVVQSQWGDTEITFDPITVSLTPVVGPGGQFLPSDPLRWSGKGSYQRAKDVFRIVSSPQQPGTLAPIISPTELRGGGITAQDALWLELELAGDLANIQASGKSDQTRLVGPLTGLVQVRQDADGWDLGVRVDLKDVAVVDPDRDRQVLASTAGASVRGKLARKFDRLDLSELAVVTPYGRVDGSGSLADLRGSPRFDLKGMLNPDWKALSNLLAKKVEPNASIVGSPRPWRVSGALPKQEGADLLSTVSGEVGLELEQVDVFGMRLSHAALVVHAQDGKVLINPIEGTLNSGRLHLEPDIVKDKQGRNWLHLGSGSGLLDAVVNDEVSHRVLSFAAPVLDKATRVRGKVSLALTDAYIPLGQGPDVQAKIDGDVLFDAVEFMPGPLADQILGVFRQERRPLLVLRDPVSIRILGRRIYQEGLIIPLANVAVIGIEGWVDFDQNLDLVASFAVVPPRKNIPVLSDLLASTQLQVPITGTFKKPRINGDVIKDRFKQMGTNVLDTLIGVGTEGLNRVLRGGPPAANSRRDFFPPFRPPDEDASPPPPAPGLDRPMVDSRKAPTDNEAQRAGGVQPKPGQARSPENPLDALDRLLPRPGQLTPEERQQLREDRRQRRLDKRAERRLRRGLNP
jgi:translocation and assembly module TamB